ncbi:hypothetical protein ACFWHR_01535 [Leucobacter sp. NPDC058333]|uniref:hypothetical protein n=1 Tax=Leucobacter sp. NPDC058333 TaxID=3346450 RepID=UPI00364B4AAC
MTQTPQQPAPDLDDIAQAEMTALTQRRMRGFLRFAVIEGGVFAILIVLIYATGLIDPDAGIWLLIAAALVGGFALMAMLSGQMKQQQRIIAENEARGAATLAQ